MYSSDSFGNGYFIQDNSNLYTNIDLTSLINARNTFLGDSTKTWTSGNDGHLYMGFHSSIDHYYLTTVSNYRVRVYCNNLITGTPQFQLRTGNTSVGESGLISESYSNPTSYSIGNHKWYVNFTNRNITSFMVSTVNPDFYYFFSVGYLDETPYINSYDQPYRLYFMIFRSSGTQNTTAFFKVARIGTGGTTTSSTGIRTLLTQDYSITCQSGSVSGTLQATDLYLYNSSDLYLGKPANLLLLKGGGDVGTIYTLSGLVDGNNERSNQWVCCAKYSSNRLLMRI